MIQKIPDADGARPGQKGRAPAPTGDKALARQGREDPQDGRGVMEPLSEADISPPGADETEAGEPEGHETDGNDLDAGESEACDGEARADDLEEAAETPETQVEQSAGPVDAPDGDGSREGVPLTLRVESLIFAVAQPVAPGRLARLLEIEVGLIHEALDLLVARWAERDTSMELVAIAGGFRFMTRPTFHPDLATLSKKAKTDHLSPAALETLSVVAYRQPLCRADIEGIRGVAAGPLLRVLLDRDLIRIAGRSPDPGHPLLYGTTKRFLDHFGLKSLKQLPDIKDLLDVR